MYFNATEILETVSDQSNLISIIIGSGVFGFISSSIYRYLDTNNKKKATLYYPLFLACTAIIEVVTEYEKLGMDYSIKQLISSSKTLDQIIYNHGSLIYLEGNDLQKLLQMKAAINRNMQYIEGEFTPNDLKNLLNSQELDEIKNDATYLLSISKNNVKALKKILV
ncbi:hypothetical protein [Methanosarcina sp.]|uniref:hypothetical protein n=1 Tax=Methanosarcina sp. TaxID=2213 RepID=UPI002AB91C4D|nr:hypothetical protein [Methanosarcina sp.]MDY9927983.1 hypothetical protein [Methanosarcina sp.]